MSKRQFEPGDPVVYRKAKHSTRPGPRAKEVVPARYGDDYSYLVDKFWVVLQKSDDQRQLVLMTRQGKKHHVSTDDPNLRRPNLWERLRYRNRFPDLPAGGNEPQRETTAVP